VSEALILRGESGISIDIAPAATAERDRVLALARGIAEVMDVEQAKVAISTIKELRQVQKGVEDSRVEVKKPVLELGKRIDTIAKSFIGDVDTELTRLHRLVREHEARLDEQRRAAEQAAQEAARKAREEEERLLREAEAARRKAEAEAAEAAKAAKVEDDPFAEAEAAARAAEAQARVQLLQAEAAKAGEAAVAPVAVVAPKVDGMHVRRTPDFEITNLAELAARRPDLVTITPKRSEILRELGRLAEWPGKNNVAKIPGIRAWWEGKVVVR
jgi:hypothetical protein